MTTPDPDPGDHDFLIKEEFERAAANFSARTKGRFDHMDVVGFTGISEGASVVEVGAGTGNFLDLFSSMTEMRVAVDLTLAMLQQGRRENPGMLAVAADGLRLPFPSQSFDLVACAQMLHHVWEPVPLLTEMRRVVKPEGKVLIVDQVAPESYEQMTFMNQLEAIRDPSHAASRAPSVMKTIVRAAGLEILEEKLVGKSNSLSAWMWPEEFPPERIEATREFIEKFGDETGMNWRREGEDWVYWRERIMILATR